MRSPSMWPLQLHSRCAFARFRSGESGLADPLRRIRRLAWGLPGDLGRGSKGNRHRHSGSAAGFAIELKRAFQLSSGNTTPVNGSCPVGSPLSEIAPVTTTQMATTWTCPMCPRLAGTWVEKARKVFWTESLAHQQVALRRKNFRHLPLERKGTLVGTPTTTRDTITSISFEKVFTTPWFFQEKLKFEVKGEAINLFNRVNLNNVSNSMSAGNFGQATGQFSPRYFQLHLRASFWGWNLSGVLRNYLRTAAKAAGVTIPDGYRFGLHNLRHSLGNWLVNSGTDVKTVQTSLRHAKVQTTLDLYTQGNTTTRSQPKKSTSAWY